MKTLNLMIRFFLLLVSVSVALVASGQTAHPDKYVPIQPSEKWFGSTVVDGSLMPFTAGHFFDMNGDVKGNQAAPLLLSTHGRYVWSDSPFAFRVTDSVLQIT